MTEFEKARDHEADNCEHEDHWNVPSFKIGANWARDYFEKESEGFREHNCKIINESLDFCDKIKTQSQVIEKLKEALGPCKLTKYSDVVYEALEFAEEKLK